MDGIAFLKWIRNYPSGDTPYILFCSSSVDKIDAQEALRLGANIHLPKPIKQEDLATVIAAVSGHIRQAKAYK
jgi:CheY-like chemotaxis protein